VAEGVYSLTEWPLPGATQKNTKTSIGTASLWTKICIWDSTNTKCKWCMTLHSRV